MATALEIGAWISAMALAGYTAYDINKAIADQGTIIFDPENLPDPLAGTTTGTVDVNDELRRMKLAPSKGGPPNPEPKSFWGKVLEVIRRSADDFNDFLGG